MDRLPGVTGTRRDLMRAALATGAGAALLATPVLAAQAQTDAELVTTLLSTEMLAVFVYSHILHAGLLTGDDERLARHLLGQERAHVRAMSAASDRLGASPPPPLLDITDADKLLAASGIPISLTQLHSTDDALRLLVHVEVVLQRSYYVALGTLDDTELQHTAAQILAAEAQHSTVLIEALFPGDVDKAVPESFVEGNPGDARV
jgi:hypothetical protein